MQSIWPYAVACIVVSVILALAVIGGYEVCRNIQLSLKERRINRRNAKRAQETKVSKCTPTSLSLWVARMLRVQESLAVHCENRGDMAKRDIAHASAYLYRQQLDRVGHPTPASFAAYEEGCTQLQLEFRTWFFDQARGRQMLECQLNGVRYESPFKLLSYSRATAIAHPGVEQITVTLVFNDCTENQTVPKEFTEKRMRLLRNS